MRRSTSACFPAWLGTDVLLQDNTCLPVPLLTGDAGLERIRWGEDQPWFRYMQRGYRYLASRKDGTFVVANRGAIMPMDIANGLCGDQLFTDFYDRPDFVHSTMMLQAEAIIQRAETRHSTRASQRSASHTAVATAA